ncbi:hypothetical protein AVEN_181347-1 [Araneus ventricosus]|uniref:Uncharacterized protein n=1 Tax=Araneus ventricosus TaxID=182803 RepID=A0A4Y2TIH8_ARAVE|nr:hypothetical protein AVEN_181347-1 [Araneus ventricosus]
MRSKDGRSAPHVVVERTFKIFSDFSHLFRKLRTCGRKDQDAGPVFDKSGHNDFFLEKSCVHFDHTKPEVCSRLSEAAVQLDSYWIPGTISEGRQHKVYQKSVKRKRNVLNVKQKLEILQNLDNGESASTDAEDVLNEGNAISHSAALQSVETLSYYMGQRGFDYGDINCGS